MKRLILSCLVLLLLTAYRGEAFAQEGGRFKPVIAGEWRVLYKPVEAGPRVNDHTIFQDVDGDWRFVGIAARWGRDLTTPAMGHAVGESLEEPMDELPMLFASYPDRRPKWAPHVIVHQNVWHMFCGPGPIRHYLSDDGIDWTFHENAIITDWSNFRDSMVLKIADGQWLMYCTDSQNTVSVYQSDDLYNWERAGTAFRAVKPATAYPRWLDISAAESPFVIHYSGAYYLSVCLTSALDFDSYANTIVLRSEDPLDFGTYAAGGPGDTADLVTVLTAHAAEYIHLPDGRWLITTCGWESYPGVHGLVPGAVLIAPLEWAPADR